MTLPSWWEITTPHKDIREKRGIREAIFAADLGDVFYGQAPLEYQDPYIFFHNTYITKGLKNLLENVFSRLNNGEGDAVIQLQTPFGGGKTHALLVLYHAVKNREKVEHLDIISKLPKLKNARVVVFVGTHADPLKGKTPWGEIAYQLGVYDKIKEHDEKRLSPGKEILSQVLGSDPVLILFDEPVEYLVKAKDFKGQILVFFQEITETVKSKNNCALVSTLPSTVPYGEEGERALHYLRQIFGRIEAIYTPVEGMEIYEVVRKRLFEDLGEEKIRKEVAQNYFNLYRTIDVPEEAKSISYRDKIERAYPFHPELIDVLYERWGSYPNFQRTRGVLRLLAHIVADLYNRKVVSPLIQSSLVNLENPEIKGEFIKHIGNEYESVIAADIAGKNAKAPRIDEKMGSEYEKYRIASGIATSVFLYSFSGAEKGKRGITLPGIRVALLRENIPLTIVGDAIAKLEEELWYFHSENKIYSFKTQPNLNRVIIEKEETISDEEVKNKLKELIKKNAGRSLEVYLWPENPSDIPDNKNLKLAVFSPEFLYDSEKGKKLAKELFDKAGAGFRVYKNTLFILAMDNSCYFNLSRSLKRFLALSEIQNDKGFLKTLTEESQKELEKKWQEIERKIPFEILNAYQYLALLEKDGSINWKNMGIPTIGTGSTISERVKQYLINQEKIISHFSPKYIIEKTFGKEENEKTVGTIYELFLKTPGMPIPENEKVIIEAISEGIKTGILAIKEKPPEVYETSPMITTNSIIIRSSYEIPSKPPPSEPSIKPEKKKVVKRLTFEAEIPWKEFSEFLRDVIIPLIRKGDVKTTIEVEAESAEGYDEDTLNRIKETLNQINAKIKNWEEKESSF